MGSTEEHQELVKQILIRFGSGSDFRLWPNNTGKAFRGRRLLSFGLKGSSDILGLRKDGRLVAIEVKTGNAKQNQDQINFMNMVRNFNGIYILARSIEDVKFNLEMEL